MKIILRFLILFAFIGPAKARANVWEVQNSWNAEWEQRYSAWVKSNWTNDVFVRPGSVISGIKTDCAEATYTMRATFAYLNHLEFAAHGADSRIQPKIVDSQMKNFDSEPSADKRFRKFIVYLLERVNSSSLAVDTYPVHIDRAHLVPGTIYVEPGTHSFQIIDVTETGLPETLNSTTPKEARLLFHSVGFPFYLPKDFSKHLDGYRAFRQPKELDTPVDRIPQAGFEQYDDSKAAGSSYFMFTDRMISRLALRTETENEKTQRNFTNLCFYSRERAPRVIEAYILWDENGRKCMSAGDYYGHSTFDRDVQLKDYFLAVQNLSQDGNFEEVTSGLRQEIRKIFSGEQSEIFGYNNLPDLNPRTSQVSQTCVVELGVPQKPILTLRELWQLIETNKLVSDPNATVLQRWGFAPFTPTCK